jgi:hypothetical protein
MPLVRIDLIEGRTEEELTALSDAIQEVMITHFAAPELDKYRLSTSTDPARFGRSIQAWATPVPINSWFCRLPSRAARVRRSRPCTPP